MMKDDKEAGKKRRAEFSARFWDLKARLTYYAISLPFALAGVAIASYPYPDRATLPATIFEVGAWALLLGAGAAGLRAKTGELEQPRMRSVMEAGRLQRAEDGQPRGLDAEKAVAKLVRGQEERVLAAERAEEWGMKWLWRLLAAGLLTWLLSRAILAFGALCDK